MSARVEIEFTDQEIEAIINGTVVRMKMEGSARLEMRTIPASELVFRKIACRLAEIGAIDCTDRRNWNKG